MESTCGGMVATCGGMDTPVPSARWQESEASMGWVREVISNTGGFAKCAE